MATMAMAGSGMASMQSQSLSRRALSTAERNRELFERQLARRRGPTPEMLFAKHIDNTRLVKSEDPVRRREMISFTLVMTLLFTLTMVYVWQHFSAIEVGYNVEAQKQQVEQLRETNRKLRLSEAELSDPSRIDEIARQLGMASPQPGQIVRQQDLSFAPDAGTVASAKAPALPSN